MVYVIATTLEGTRAALAAAAPLARGANAELRIVVPQIGAPIVDDDGAVDAASVFVKRYKELAVALGTRASVEVCICKSLDEFIARVCSTTSLAVIGGPAGRWLTSPEERFANHLARLGCRVLFAADGTKTTQRRVAIGCAAAL